MNLWFGSQKARRVLEPYKSRGRRNHFRNRDRSRDSRRRDQPGSCMETANPKRDGHHASSRRWSARRVRLVRSQVQAGARWPAKRRYQACEGHRRHKPADADIVRAGSPYARVHVVGRPRD